MDNTVENYGKISLAKEVINEIEPLKNLVDSITTFIVEKGITATQLISNIDNFQNKAQEIKKDVEILENTCDSKTQAKLKAIMNKPLDDSLDSFHQQIKDLMNYNILYQNKWGNAMIHSFNKNLCVIDPYLGRVSYSYPKHGIEYVINNFDNLKNKVSVSTSKLLIYAIQNINFDTNISKFTFTDYCNDRNIKNDTDNRNQLKKDLIILQSISNIAYINKKEDRQLLITFIHKNDYSRGNITLKFDPDFTESLKNCYMYFPHSLLRLNGKENANTFMLGYYIFTQMRIPKKDCQINKESINVKLSIKGIINYLTIPTFEAVRKTDRMYQRRIIDPIDKIVNNLNDLVPELNIQFEADYATTNEFEKGFIMATLNNKKITKKYLGIDENRKKKSIKHNTDKKKTNINSTKQYLREGKKKEEIAKILNVSIKTMNRYIIEINKWTKE